LSQLSTSTTDTDHVQQAGHHLQGVEQKEERDKTRKVRVRICTGRA